MHACSRKRNKAVAIVLWREKYCKQTPYINVYRSLDSSQAAAALTDFEPATAAAATRNERRIDTDR